MTVSLNDTFTAVTGGLTLTRSKFKAATYERREYTDSDYLDAYEGSALFARVVDLPADHATRMWREWQADENQINAIEELEREMDVASTVREAYVDARLFGEGYIFMDNGTDITEPIDPETSPPLRYVRKLDRWQISEGEYDYDPTSPYYGKPRDYDLLGTNMALHNIHPSRVVHLVGKRRRQYGATRNRYGDSVIQEMFDDLKGYDAIMANVSDMVMEAKVDVLKIDNLMQRVTNPDELQALQTKLALAMHAKATNGALILDMEDEDWEQKTMQFGSIADIIDRFQITAAGAARIPRAMLFGTSAGGLGATGELEIRNYYDNIKSIQENELTPAMRVLDQMIIRTALNSIPPEVHYRWRSLWQMNDEQKAEIGKKIVDKYVQLVNAQVFPDELAFDQVVNEMTEAGVAPGLEKLAEEWRGRISRMNGDDLDDGGEDGSISA